MHHKDELALERANERLEDISDTVSNTKKLEVCRFISASNWKRWRY